MAFATGVAKQVIIAEETSEGVNPVTGGQTLRRVSSDLALNIDSYESQEILVSQQLRDARHGVHRPQGTFAGQVSPGSFSPFWEGILRNTFTDGVVLASVALTLALGPPGTLSVVSGFDAAGFLEEDIVVISGAASPNTALNGVNLRINSLSDTTITTRDLPTTGLTAGTTGLTACTITVVGKKLWIPATGLLEKSYSIEHFFSDVSLSELFTGCKFGQTSVALPSTGLVTFSTQIIGVDMVQGTARQLTSPTAQTTSNALAAVNGKISYDNVDQAIITGMNLQLQASLAADPVVGSDVVPHIFQGRFRVTGNLTAMFEDETIDNTFITEQEVSISVWLTVGSGAAADFMRFTMPRVKLMSAAKSDSDMSLIQSFSFTALENVDNTAADLTTLVIQDSLA